MPDFRVIVELKDVALGDAESIAQDIYDSHASTLDPGDLTVSVSQHLGGNWFDTGYEPTDE
ncbi:MAG: hypothetical protein ACJ780_10120 [Solirubrobacteraceae bacterium]|jgi:hypothetical protein